MITFSEIIPSLQQLSTQDKLKTIQFLANQLAEEQHKLSLLKEGETHEVWSPYDAFSAETVLTQMLDEYSQTSNQITKE